MLPVSDQSISRMQHATCIVAHGNAALIIGKSGSGKSSLALAMMGLGAKLVADDRVILHVDDTRIIATAPAAIHGLIEARGIGILTVEPAAPAPIRVVIDLDQVEPARMPPIRHTKVMGQSMPMLYKVDTPHFPAALMQYLKSGRQGEDWGT